MLERARRGKVTLRGLMIGCVGEGKARKSNIEGLDDRLCWRGARQRRITLSGWMIGRVTF